MTKQFVPKCSVRKQSQKARTQEGKWITVSSLNLTLCLLHYCLPRAKYKETVHFTPSVSDSSYVWADV